MMIGQKFPVTHLPAVLADGTVVEDYAFLNPDGYTVVVFYPYNFTLVCPSELLEYDKKLEHFRAVKTRVVSCSVDSTDSHQTWRKLPQKEGGIGPVGFAMLADTERQLSGALGILNPEGVAYRASYLLDKKGVIRHMVVNDLPLGRSANEMQRMVYALGHFEESGEKEMCPAGWNRGEPGLRAADKAASYFSTLIQQVKKS